MTGIHRQAALSPYRHFVAQEAPGAKAVVAEFLRSRQLGAPVVVGGTGGSGTRLMVQMLRALGVDMGQRVNGCEDAMAFYSLYERHIPEALSGTIELLTFGQNLVAGLRGHLESPGMAESARPLWGVKNPRSLFLLPWLDTLLAPLRFLHVVRDGLAMATSANQNQLHKHGRGVLSDAYDHLPEEQRSLLLWAQLNGAAAAYGQTMGPRYLVVRYEDATQDPRATVATIAHFLGLPSAAADIAITPVRRRSLDFSCLDPEVQVLTAPVLHHFGYPC